MLGHFIHAQSYIARHIASDIGVHIQNKDAEGKRVLHSMKASKRASEESNSDKSEFFKEYQQVQHQRCKSNQVNMSDKVKAQSNWHSEVSPGKRKNENLKNWQLEVSPDEKIKI